MNILILTAKYGMGHYSASMSIKQRLEEKNATVEVVDFFEYVFPLAKKIIYGGFNFLVSKCSKVYNFFYKFSSNTNSVPFALLIKGKIEKLIKEKNVDIVISTFPICSRYVSVYKKQKDKNLKLYTYITDIEVNKEWITDETDAYFVASNRTKEQLKEFNIKDKKIKIVGIPVKKEFDEEEENVEKNEIVIMGGGLGLIPSIKNILEELAKRKDIQITLLAGKNKKIIEKYNNKYENITVVGYTNQVYEYMKRAKLIISKAGGVTLFEAIHSKKPIYILYPFLSQEKGNANFIEEKEIGVVVWKKKDDIAKDVIQLLNDTKRLEKMKSNMKAISDKLEKTDPLEIYREEILQEC